MATKKKAVEYPIITKGSHLTVIKHENGKTDLVWDDEQLLKDVEEAIASVKSPKKARKTK
jgi:hypothetical protein